MEVLKGLSFHEARIRLLSAFRDALESVKASEKRDTVDGKQLMHLTLRPLAVSAIYFVATAVLGSSYSVEVLAIAVALLVYVVLNVIVVFIYKRAESLEVRRTLQEILDTYELQCSMLQSAQSPATENPISAPTLEDGATVLTSGHSQVSIVHTLRDGQWLRLPVLLLAEGDIIALMGGDIAPGRCNEIERTEVEGATGSGHHHGHSHSHHHLHNSAPGTEPRMETRWQLGRALQAGEKVLIRNRRYFSQQLPERHRNETVGATEGEAVGLDAPLMSHSADEDADKPSLEHHAGEDNNIGLHDEWNDHNQQAPGLDYGNRHRTLGAESVEILSLCGDVRCFRMAETPLASFLHQITVTQSGAEGEGSQTGLTAEKASKALYSALQMGSPVQAGASQGQTHGAHMDRPSLIRTLFQAIVVDAAQQAQVVILLLTAAGMIARLLACTTERGRNAADWAHYVIVPTATACMFFLPLAVPMVLILAEASATADVLASTEITLRHGEGGASAPKSTGGEKGSRSSAAKASQSPHKQRKGHGGEFEAVGRASASGDGDGDHENAGEGDGMGDEESLSDQFVDEDLDDRADDIAEEVSTQVTWARYWAYLRRVLYQRLCLCALASTTTKDTTGSTNAHGTGKGASEDFEDDLLPVPLARTRFLEVLGAVTMVCFVDDDVICEGYSVTEEIFLLMDDHQTNSTDPMRGGARQNDDTAQDADGSKEKASKQKQSNVKGVVLDLHANPEATGSRFENPQWWRYLPSLKPLGLNAMLTYSYGAAASTQLCTSPESAVSTPPPVAGAGETKLRGALAAQSMFAFTPGSERSRTRSSTLTHQTHQPSPRTVMRGIAGADAAAAASALHQHHTERALVRHIRHLLPQEALRELSEEIGFEQTDLSPFLRVLEVNVLAPGLENAHLLEDTHQWGQEESRRRGSLLPQLRGGVYKDFRDGSLQMMSLGDPSLVLNYCREYWDGSTLSITPLSSGDRAEVLSVYERWRLEDFEVVAFCYSPLPTAGLNPLLYAKEEPASVGGAMLTRHGSASVSGTQAMAATHSSRSPHHHNSGSFSVTQIGGAGKPSPGLGIAPFTGNKHNTLFFVDPITTLDLQRVAAGITSKSRSAAHKSQPQAGKPAGEDGSGAIFRSRTNPTPHRSSVVLFPPSSAENEVGGRHSDSADDTDPLIQSGGIQRAVTLDPKTLTRADNNASADSAAESTGEARPPRSPQRRVDAPQLASSDGVAGEAVAGHNETSNLRVGVAVEEAVAERRGVPGGTLIKSVSLDRIEQYAPSAGETGSGESTPTTAAALIDRRGTDGNRLHAPGPLRVSTSAKELRDTASSSDTFLLPVKNSMPQTPQLLFFDEDTATTTSEPAPTDLPTPAGFMRGPDSASGADSPARNAASPTSHPLIRSTTHSGVGFSAPVVSFDDSAVRSRTAGGSLSAKGILTPPLAPRPRSSDRNPAAASFASATVAASAGEKVTARAGSPQLRKHASAYAVPHPFFAAQDNFQPQAHLMTSKQRLQQQQQRSNQQARQQKRASIRQLWSLMRQQVFLGMAASSVPVRKDVPNVKEDLDSAGVRFVYFSAQNMKRSKPVAEKIGIPFDWNCAISLRELEGGTGAHDPHRHISNYADWDVLARMPHGIEAIKAHLETVDNVPLLVSLFTDATPLSVRQMVEVFRENGEVVLTIGGGYRSHNASIYRTADLGCSVSVLPGLSSTGLLLPADEGDLVRLFPAHSATSLCRADVLLSFRLIGLGTINLLQTPSRRQLGRGKAGSGDAQSAGADHAAGQLNQPLLQGAAQEKENTEPLRLAALMEVIRKGRIFLRNAIQALAFYCIATVSLGLWPLAALGVPLSLPVSPSPGIAMLFCGFYVPAISLTLLLCGEPEGVMKNTPRKNVLQRRHKDLQRFLTYLAVRSGYVLASAVLVGWFAAASTMRGSSSLLHSLGRFYFVSPDSAADRAALWLVRDVMSAQVLVGLLSQSLTLLVRGQVSLAQFPWPWRLPEGLFYAVSVLVLAVHAGVLVLRQQMRAGDAHGHTYSGLDWPVWLLMGALPLLGVAVGVLVNRDDDRHYRRYLQFLRLEFDTRLGMHSPR